MNPQTQATNDQCNQSIISLFKWFEANKLSTNIAKMQYYSIFKNSEVPNILNIKIENVTTCINKVTAVRYLDDKLKFDKHISELNNSLTKRSLLSKSQEITYSKIRKKSILPVHTQKYNRV